jgi:hypothetical protein
VLENRIAMSRLLPELFAGYDVAAGEEHVKIGHGRFYGDVAPIRGVYKGAAGTAEHDVSVRMTRLGS